jgi:carboxynorspermidine decarboxylase
MSSPVLRHTPPIIPDGRSYFDFFDPASVPSPCFVVDIAAVEHNLRILREVADEAGATVLLALKAFALPAIFPLVRNYLDGVCASGVYEARLGREEIAPQPGKSRRFQVHTYAPAYTESELSTVVRLSDHVNFNSYSQWQRVRHLCPPTAARYGLRINPEYSTGTTPLYDPCAPGSRLGITAEELARQMGPSKDLAGISELHMHTLCEADASALEKTTIALEERFGDVLKRDEIRYLNIGGGHHITRPDYRRDQLVDIIQRLHRKYNVHVIMEPGEAVAIHSGILVATVLDLPRNGVELAILDTSATAHMPDTLEMPYTPHIWGTRGDGPWRYQLGGQTCLAGDVLGEHRFTEPLQIGDRIIFDDMSHYTMVKTTTFNGIPLPAIALWDSRSGTIQVVREPRYEDFRSRLG